MVNGRLDARTRAAVSRRASGASGTHGDRRLKRLKTRSTQKQAAIRESR